MGTKGLKNFKKAVRYITLLYVTLLINRTCGRLEDLVVSTLYPGSSGPVVNPGRGHCVTFFGKTTYPAYGNPTYVLADVPLCLEL